MAPNQPEDVLVPQNIERTRIDYDRFVNNFSKLRQPSVIRELTKLYSQKQNEAISLAGGLPNPTTFPFQELALKLSDGTDVKLSGKALHDSLQYIPTEGYPSLLEKLKKIQWQVHRPPHWEDYEVLVTPGSQDGLCKTIEMSLEPGEPIIVQHPVYSGIEAVLKPYQADIMAIEQDDQGIRPDLLRKALQKKMKPQDGYTKHKGVPKLLYLNTTGANPTGVSLPDHRKKEIYQIACEYNLIILEDDPYYYLHFNDNYATSFLSMDTEGRVIRYDSFSKIVSAGLRVGFLTGPKHLIKRIELHVQASSLHASSLSQVLVDNILQNWGIDGLFKHFSYIQSFYKERRDAMLKAAEKHLTGLAEWTTPTAGMFLWIKVKDLPDVHRLVTVECVAQGVMFVTGHAYVVNYGEPCPYLRACYSLATPEQMNTGMLRLADAIRLECAKHQAQLRTNTLHALTNLSVT